ncbi:MAG: bifunctional phosphoribosylaminoimidazolecarboxamide formyltransferase/IMP cyclohydrolase [Planctomycetes bacterium]|nr:bifunctional phosphoribosylaminoimidazolecarboxamide formyltransferase/IMP cyclohydrolase [Planctomycetota bacterium]
MSQRIQRALVSVSDKSGIEAFAGALAQMGVELLSTGGTFAALRKAGIAVREVSDYTGFPEMMDGRVKTLHPKVHGGILALRDDAKHAAAMRAHQIAPIDLVVVNLYPFEATVQKSGITREEAIEQIDIGGPSMVRSAAKNHLYVGIVTDPADYGRVLEELQRNSGVLGLDLKRELAAKAFGLTARYDAAIARWMFEAEKRDGKTQSAYPPSFSLAGVKVDELRYGENPHQTAALYRTGGTQEPCIAGAKVLNGKTLSYNNLVDLDSALALAKEFDAPFVAVIKHNNPCGAAAGDTSAAALELAWAGDPVSAFGSVLAFTRPVDLASAEFLVSGNRFVEAIAAPSFDADALKLLTEKPKWGKNVRLLEVGEFKSAARDERDFELKKLVGGFLLQGRDLAAADVTQAKVMTARAPTRAELAGLDFANKVAKHVKSNAIVLTKGTRVLGVGAGQMSRVDSVRLAVQKAGAEAKGAVLGSDAFFPFADGVELALEAGVTAILQPGGSVRDAEVIAACDKQGAAMVFSGVRHFRH